MAKGWFASHAEAEAKKDIIPRSERLGNIIGLAAILLILLYFVAHQTWSTGFFTTRFGLAEAFFFYASFLYGMVPLYIRSLAGRKNLARFFDVLGSVLFLIALAWLLMVFPFDFSYFADVLPTFLRFLLQWISNDIARVLMTIGIIGTLIMGVYNALLYVFVRRELQKPSSHA